MATWQLGSKLTSILKLMGNKSISPLEAWEVDWYFSSILPQLILATTLNLLIPSIRSLYTHSVFQPLQLLPEWLPPKLPCSGSREDKPYASLSGPKNEVEVLQFYFYSPGVVQRKGFKNAAPCFYLEGIHDTHWVPQLLQLPHEELQAKYISSWSRRD